MKRRTKKHPLVEKVFHIVVNTEPHDFRHLTVKNIAKKLKVSPEYLARVFKREYGYTIQYVIIVYKVMRARMMLDTGMPIKEVTYLIGCCHQSHFARLFKKVSPYSPGEYCRINAMITRLRKLLPRGGRRKNENREDEFQVPPYV